MIGNWVNIEFDCLPLRTLGRLDVPVDASPVYEQFVLRVQAAVDRHGQHNAYYLHRGRCVYHLTNHDARGRLEFAFEGTALTDSEDCRTRALDLTVNLREESCSWLNERIVEFFVESVRQAVRVEFDRYIEAGDLARTRERIERLDRKIVDDGSFLGMDV